MDGSRWNENHALRVPAYIAKNSRDLKRYEKDQKEAEDLPKEEEKQAKLKVPSAES